MISFGIDIGTTTLRAIAVEIQVGNFGKRSQTPVGEALCVFTPYLADRSLDDKAIVKTLADWVKENSLPSPDVGSILFTGEAQRASNALAVSDSLTNQWQGLLSAQLNPDLESRLSALGSGALDLSARHPGKTIIHIDIGGGTSNFSRIENGEIIDTSCLDIGCRKWILDQAGKVLHSTKAGKAIYQVPDTIAPSEAKKICDKMVSLLVAHARGEKIEITVVAPWRNPPISSSPLISVSGGVVECREPGFYYGDLGPFFLTALKDKVGSLSTYQGKATALGVSTFGFHVSGRSIHVDEDFGELPRNIPLLTEEEFLKNRPQKTFAILEPAEDAEAAAKKWAKRLFPEETVVFLLEKNLAKSFGHFFPSPRPKLIVLDEIKADAIRQGVRVLDLTYVKSTDRYLASIKNLHLF